MKTVVRDLAVIHGSDRASRGGVCHFVCRGGIVLRFCGTV
jgi:hypothetical protein